MSILITGAAGFIGQQLAVALLQSTPSSTLLTLTDLQTPPIPPSTPSSAISRITTLAADLTDPNAVSNLLDPARPFSAIYLLHGIMSSGAESNFALGLRVNLHATQLILERLRTSMSAHDKWPVKVIYASSVAVYGPSPSHDFAITETNFPPVPTSSYGAEKLAAETLVNEYSRRGYVDGRALRLPTVTVRAGKPTAAASSFASGIIREPLNGVESEVPVRLGTRLWICSPWTVVRNLVVAGEVPRERFEEVAGGSRVVNLPGIKVSVEEMLEVLERVGGREKRALVKERFDEEVDRIVSSWSSNFDTTRAKRLGFVEDMSLLEGVRMYVREYVEGKQVVKGKL